jgi:hypothetical protein
MADAETDAKPVDQDALVADIEQTRLQLARTIDAIADRVSPLIVGAAAGAVLVSVTVVFLVRRRKR